MATQRGLIRRYHRSARLLAALALLATTLVLVVARPAAAAAGIDGTVAAPPATNFGRTITFTGTIINTGSVAAAPSEAFDTVAIVDDGSTGLTGLVIVAPVGGVAAGATAAFTVMAQITAVPGTMARLRLQATGVTTSAAVVDPVKNDLDGAAFTVTDAVELTVSAERKQGATYSACVLPCNVGTDDGIRYKVRVENRSDNAVSDVNIVAAVPANTAIVMTDIPAGAVPGGIAANDFKTFILEVTVNDPPTAVDPPQPGTVLTFSATTTYDITLPSALNDRPAVGSSATFLATVVGPMVSLVIAPTPPTTTLVPRGSNISYVITATNASDAAFATGLTISFPIPEETTFVSAMASAGGSAPAGDPLGPITTTFLPGVASPGTASLTVVVKVGTLAAQDPGPANDIDASASATFGPAFSPSVNNVPPVAHELSVAGFTLSALGGPSATTFGKTVTFAGSITNTGTETFASVNIVDDGSTALTVTPTSIGPVAPGATLPFSVPARITAVPGTMATPRLKVTGLTANLLDVDPTAGLNGASFTATDVVKLTVTAARTGADPTVCAATCTVSIDDGIRYTVKVENLSDLATAAVDVRIIAPAPANTTSLGTSNIPAGPITVLAGTPQTFFRDVTVNDPATDADPPQPGAVLTFSATTTYDTVSPSVLDNRPAIGSPATFLANVVDPLLTITNVLNDGDGGQLVSGDPVGSTIVIDNTGNTDATKTEVVVNLTANLVNPTDVRIGGSPAPVGQFSVTPTTVTVRIGTGAGAMGGTITPADTPITVSFSATVASSLTGSPPMAQTTAMVSFDNGGVSPKMASAALTILRRPIVSLVIVPTPPSATPVPRGSNITYVVTASNASGVADATGLTINFPIPAKTTLVSATPSAGGSVPAGGPLGPITTTFATVASPGTASLTVVVKVDATDAGAFQNPGPANDIQAVASTTFGPIPNLPVNATMVAHELSVATVALATDLVDSVGQLLAGEVVNGTVTVDNTGTADATATVVSVALVNLSAPTNVRINGGLPPDPAQVSYNAGTQQLTVRVGAGAGAGGGTVTPAASIINITFDATVVAVPTGSPPMARATTTVVFGNGGSSNGPVADEIEIKAQPNITLAIAATPPPTSAVPKNTDISYVISATNAAGLAAATNVTVSFTTPEETTFVSATAPGGTLVAPAPGTVGLTTAMFSTVASGGPAATLTVVVHVGANPAKDPGVAPANDIEASATASYGPGVIPIPNATAAVAHEISAADLTLAISPVSQSIQKAKPVDVEVTVGNLLGPNPATGTKTVTINLVGTGIIQTAAGCTINVGNTQAVCSFATPLNPGIGTVGFTLKVRGDVPGTATLTATLVTTGVEIDETPANNVPVIATVTFLQSSTDLSITASTPPPLIVDGPTQALTYTLNVVDPDAPPNSGDAAEGVMVSIPIPAQVRALAASFGGPPGSCTVPPGPGGIVTCTVGAVSPGTPVAVVLTLQGTALLAAATPIVATVTATNNDPTTPNTAAANVTVIPQPVDLSIANVVDRIITTTGPGDTEEPGAFTVVVTNNAVTPNAFATRPYTLTIAVDGPATVADLVLTSSDAACAPAVANVLTCTSTGLAAGSSKSFLVTATIKSPGPITVRSTVTLNVPEQTDPTSNNNVETWTVTRNLPPAAQADVGPTVPVGSTLVFDVLRNDTDGDAADVANLTPVGPFTGIAGLAVTIVGKKLQIVVPATEPLATLTIGYAVTDGRGVPIGSTATTLKVRVAAALTTTVDGSFGIPPTALPKIFGVAAPDDLLDATPTPIDVLAGDLGRDANNSAFAGVTYRLAEASGVKVTGAAVTVEDGPLAGQKVARYVPAKGYTSDVPGNAPDLATAPPDSFNYRTTAMLGGSELFSVAAGATVAVRNQLPIGQDTLIEIFTENTPVPFSPTDNDIDGNTVADPVAVAGGTTFRFDDEGKLDPAHKLKISCIGPAPAPDPVTGLPPVPGPNVCDEPAMAGPGEKLVVEAPPDAVGTVSGKIEATLAGTGATAFRSVSVSRDASVVGDVPFVAVVVDNYRGASFSLINIRVPNKPPELIAITQRVPKNSPPVEVLDTVKAARDPNGDVVEISSVTDPPNGTATITPDRTKILYQPDTDYAGPDSLILNVSDGRGAGSNSAKMAIEVFAPTVQPVAGAGGGGQPGGALPATGGDPLALTAAGGISLLLGAALVQAGRRRQSRPLLAGARHLR